MRKLHLFGLAPPCYAGWHKPTRFPHVAGIAHTSCRQAGNFRAPASENGVDQFRDDIHQQVPAMPGLVASFQGTHWIVATLPNNKPHQWQTQLLDLGNDMFLIFSLMNQNSFVFQRKLWKTLHSRCNSFLDHLQSWMFTMKASPGFPHCKSLFGLVGICLSLTW